MDFRIKKTRMHFVLICFIFITLYNFCDGIGMYDGYSMYSAVPVDLEQLAYLKALRQLYDVNYWKPPGGLYRPVDFAISPNNSDRFLKDAKENGIYFKKMIDNIQKTFDEQTVTQYIRRQMASMNWDTFFRLVDIYAWLFDLVEQYPSTVELKSMGRSHEGRELMVLRVVLDSSQVSSTVIIEGGIHAREWISPAFVTYMINAIVTAPTSEDKKLKSVAYKHEWYFIPVLNPDGYEYSHTVDRQWRKNRNGPGVDLNRNFDHAFGRFNPGDAYSDDYPGTHPFSEMETRALANFITENKKHLKLYIAVHSYGQVIIIPFAETPEHLANYDEAKDVLEKAARNISQRYNTQYTVGTTFETVGYQASGLSTCWVKATFGVPLVISMELRDQGVEGFALGPSKIRPTCEETLDGVVALLSYDDGNQVPKNETGHRLYVEPHSGQGYRILDEIAIVFNVILFIIVRFD